MISEAEAKKEWWVRSGIWLTYPNRGNNKHDHGHRDVAIVGNTIWCKDDGERRAMWIGAESDNITIANNTLRGGGVKYGGEHDVDPLELITIKDDVWIVSGKIRSKDQPEPSP